MAKKIGRRDFVKNTARIGLGFAAGGRLLYGRGGATTPHPGETVEVAIAEGDDIRKTVHAAVEALGGIRSFIPKGAKVALLPNVQSRHPGTYTKPEILRGVAELCREAEAAAVDCLSWQTMKQWEDTGLATVAAEEKVGIRTFERDESLFRAVSIPGAKSLPEARILEAFYEYDLWINMPITKDHAGNKFTGTLKNLMGLNSPVNNRTFHRPNWKTDPDDLAHLDQCIVDLNRILKPALNVVDAVEFVVTNGPFGPGELIRPRKVIAGVDGVAVDAVCCGLWDLDPADIIMIRRGAEQGLGVMDPSRIRLREVKV